MVGCDEYGCDAKVQAEVKLGFDDDHRPILAVVSLPKPWTHVPGEWGYGGRRGEALCYCPEHDPKKW